MLTKDIIEGLLYITNYRELTKDCLKACHIIDTGRNWQPVQHPELYFLDSFKLCSYLIIIDKQVHVFLLGDKIKNKTYNVLNIEGFTCELLNLNTSDLIKYIKEECKKVDKYYLPSIFNQRIIYLNPNYTTEECDVFIFNKQDFDSNLFKKATWSIGRDMYSMNNPEHILKAEDILKEILQEVTDEN